MEDLLRSQKGFPQDSYDLLMIYYKFTKDLRHIKTLK